MDERLKREILEKGINKRNHKIKNTWSELALEYKDYFNNGEDLRQLQTGCPYDLQLLYVIDNADYETEQYYHRYFSSMYNIRGEYYDYNFVMKWIKKDKLTKQVLKQEGILF